MKPTEVEHTDHEGRMRTSRLSRYTWFLSYPGIKKAVIRIALIALLLYIFIPLVCIVLWAFAGEWYYPSVFPQQLSIKWWIWVFQNTDISRSFILSFTIAPIVTLATIVLCVPAAYAFARFDIPGKRALLLSFLIPRAFPAFGMHMVLAVIFYYLNLVGTLLGVVIIHLIGGLVYMVWIATGTFQGISPTLEEAARDAGANRWQTFFRITLPLALPGIIVGSLFVFLNSLDESEGSFLVGVPNVITLPVLMYSLITDYHRPVASIFSLILLLPNIVVLLFASHIMRSEYIAAGFGKGL